MDKFHDIGVMDMCIAVLSSQRDHLHLSGKLQHILVNLIFHQPLNQLRIVL
jgi:hypothetical protein